MLSPHSKAPWFLAATVLALFVVSPVSVAQQRPAHKRAVKQAQPAPEPPPAPPPPPPTLEQMPALAPKVKFNNGRLTIVAENSTLADILRAVHAQTGAVVEIPPNATERVVTHLGPGLTRDVLATLLNGSHFNYVMLGSPTQPDRIDKIILTSKSIAAPDTSPAMPPGENAGVEPQMDEPESPAVDISEQPVEDAVESQAVQENQQQPNGQPQVKTPEQLLKELQIQQMQQQQQGTPPEGGQPNPPQ